MRIAITGGTGFVGRHLASVLLEEGHEVALIARGVNQAGLSIRDGKRVVYKKGNVSNLEELLHGFTGCDVIAHLAGINREIGCQTFDRIHSLGTQNVLEAATKVRARKVVLLSYLNARPDCGFAYHESKWRAEQIVRSGTIDYAIVKAGVIYGKGDHMIDHLSRALRYFPIFAAVGFERRVVRPVTADDVSRVLAAALVSNRMSRKSVAVVGPEEVSLGEVAKRVGKAMQLRVMVVPLPVSVHVCLAAVAERVFSKPIVTLAQVRMLAEGISEAKVKTDPLPDDLKPLQRLEMQKIQESLPTEIFEWAQMRKNVA